MRRGIGILLVLVWLLGVGSTAWGQGDPQGGDPTWQPPIPLSGEVSATGRVLRLPSYMSQLKGTIINPPRAVSDFEIPATTGETFRFRDSGGKLVLVYFGYMACPDVCPTTLADMLRAYREVGEPAEQVDVLFVTLDPERDTLDRMSHFMRAFHPDFIGLRTEDAEQLAALAENFGVIYQRREVDSAAQYLIDHSAAVFLVGPDGNIIAQYPFGVRYTEIAADLRLMLDYMIAPQAIVAASMDAAPIDPTREFRIVIPEGTGALIQMGQDPGIIPLRIDLTIGQRDILVLENHDKDDFLVGGIWVAPYETVSKQFYEPQTFVGLCTITVGSDLIEIVVSEPQ